MPKTREQLLEAFKPGAIPKAEDFADIINTSINQDQDGLEKKKAEPLKIEGNETGELINFYKDINGDPIINFTGIGNELIIKGNDPKNFNVKVEGSLDANSISVEGQKVIERGLNGKKMDVYANVRVLRNLSEDYQDGLYIGYGNRTGPENIIRFYTGIKNKLLAMQINSNGTVESQKDFRVLGNFNFKNWQWSVNPRKGYHLYLDCLKPSTATPKTSNLYLARQGDGSYKVNLFVSGKVAYKDIGKWSSARYKENIAEYKTDFNSILKLEPKKYKLKSDKAGESKIGYIAEDLDQLGLKDIVSYDELNRPDMIEYDLISIYTLEVVKQQSKMIEKLQETMERFQKDPVSRD